MSERQPIIRGIQSVGSVTLYYKYNGNGGILTSNSTFKVGGSKISIDTSTGFGVECAGFRLDAEFLRANPQIASSFMIPILGGGAVALTNNNRSGTLNIRTTKVSTPNPASTGDVVYTHSFTIDDKGTESTDDDEENVIKGSTTVMDSSKGIGSMLSGSGLGPVDGGEYYDLTLLLQMQQGQPGGDSAGATLTLVYKFNDLYTTLQFDSCTVANIDPVGLAGNDAVDYNAQINYLNWSVNMSASNEGLDATYTPS